MDQILTLPGRLWHGIAFLYDLIPFLLPSRPQNENNWPTASMPAHSKENALVTWGDSEKKCKLCQQRAVARKTVAQCATISLSDNVP